jgi:DNA processing protein
MQVEETLHKLRSTNFNRANYWKLNHLNLHLSDPSHAQKPLPTPLEKPLNGVSGACRQLSLEQLQSRQIQIVSFYDPAYPPGLKRLTYPPPLLFYKGSLPILNRPALAVIGSRKCTSIALKLAFGISQNLCRAGFTVLNGMALGIDTSALKGAAACRETLYAVAVLGSNIDQCYPALNFALYRELSERGCVLSEYPPGFKTQPHHFIYRNQLVAALADGVIVVEAGYPSGTFHTVNFALDLQKPIFVFDLPAEGNQILIEMGATPIRKPEDVFNQVFEELFAKRPC